MSPIDDLDSYWHVVLGRQILSGHTLTGLGSSWLAEPSGSWTTSQWLSEVSMALAVDHLGWRALVIGRVVLTLALVASLWLALLRRCWVLLGVPVTIVLVTVLYPFLQDRPQTASLVFLPWAAAWAHRLLVGGPRPPLAVVALVSVLWAQVHGLWVVLPGACLLACLACVADGPRRRARDLRAALLVTACAGAGVLNPTGLTAFVLPLRFRSATSEITEWRPTTLTSPLAVAFATLVVVILLEWIARTGARARRSELFWVAGWVAFAAPAVRNVPVAAIMLTPLTLTALDRTWGARRAADGPVSGRIESAVLATVCLLAVVVSAALTVQRLATLDPLRSTPALQIARSIATSPGPVRIWNDYNASGALIAFGGGRARLVIDGRADLWGGDRIGAVSGVPTLAPGWQERLRAFRPDRLVLAKNAPLVTLLTREQSWRTVLIDGDYALLEPAGAHA